jgi:hypothetical protein
MPVIHDTIPQFFNGVSQQAPNLRRVSQVEEQLNCVSSITEGVLPRPPSEHLAELSASTLGNAYIHTINRDTLTRFIVIIKNGSIEVYDLEGVQQTVTYPAGTSYLTASDAKKNFEAYTVKDYTFILNKTIETAQTSKTAGTITRTVQTFTNLKDTSDGDGAGSFYKIEGDANNSFDSYYLEKTINASGSDGDTYTEIVDPRLTSIGLDASTMPHQLVRTGTTTFELQVIPWDEKASGDEETNPFPSFTGSTINDIFLYRNRFGFLSGDNVILSESGGDNFFNFFRTTVTQLLDSDPIDVSANNTRVSDLQFAVPFTDSLLLFAEQTQFELGSDDLLTPTTVEIKPTTEFVASMKARPKLAGRNIYFTMERTDFTGLREYFVDADNRGNDAADVTKHVPRYIPKDVFKILPSSNDDSLFLLTEQETNIIYVYQWYWAQTQGGLNKLQSAWHKWDLGTGTNILNIDLIDNTIYMIIERDGKTYLESINLTPRKLEPDLLFQIRLDRRGSYLGSYDSLTDLTTWSLPFSTTNNVVVVRDGGFTENAGLAILNVSQPTSTTIIAVGDHTKSEVIIGFEYHKRLQLSPIYQRTQSQSGGSIARLGGRLQLRKLLLSYSDSSFFTVEVTPKTRSTSSRDFTAPIGSNESIIGGNVPRDGVFSVSIGSKADTTIISIVSDSYLPFAVTSAEWEGFFHSKAR